MHKASHPKDDTDYILKGRSVVENRKGIKDCVQITKVNMDKYMQ